MRMESVDMTAQNIEKIGALFPICITETKDADGKPKKAINFDLLRQMLSGDVIEGDEAYEFTWVGKKAAIVEANKPIRKTLRPCKEESVNWNSTENLYIEGDNLEVLKLLQESYLGKVKMIYIDPPYNTGHDFVYPDSFIMDNEDYNEGTGYFDEDGNVNYSRENSSTAGKYHSDWCSLIYSRLLLARNLLKDDGVIFISIDDNEVDNLRKMCDEVFGEANLVAIIPWQSRASIQNDTDFSINHEYICVYAKRRRRENRRLKESNYTEWHKHDSFVCRPLPLDRDKFDNPDNDPRGPWKADPLDAPNVRPNLTYPVTNPNTGEQHLPPRGRHWRFLPRKFSSALADNRIVWKNNGLGRPQLKVFYEEKKEFGSVDNSWFSAEKIGTSTNGTKELMKIFDGTAYFDTPKPVSLLLKLMTLGNTDGDDIILDFFSGSATTAHAVMQLNADDGGHRKFIMVQLPEPCDEKSEAYKAGYSNICEIGKERIRRAAKKIAEEHPNAKFDGGFRVLKLDDTNMKDVYYAPADYEQNVLDLLESNVKEDRTDLDLLFGCLLEWGLPLLLPYKSENIEGCTVHNYNDGDLIACFDENVSESVIKMIAEMQPLRAVFRDSSFTSSPAKINVTEIFKRLAPDTSVKVL
ncbi:site-specific DNA-methyltransferase [Bifidobacterium moukalabense]|uniref:site-specific DNA-methyltransferase n=1 Tax=Bifidobacterium moukalabense TaxID=1333651 RepID=UPI001BB0D7DC|nr:site-specific DNA-methyltransferase [Bifidobacterium moukalabense]